MERVMHLHLLYETARLRDVISIAFTVSSDLVVKNFTRIEKGDPALPL